jgi:hypothetical protein
VLRCYCWPSRTSQSTKYHQHAAVKYSMKKRDWIGQVAEG